MTLEVVSQSRGNLLEALRMLVEERKKEVREVFLELRNSLEKCEAGVNNDLCRLYSETRERVERDDKKIEKLSAAKGNLQTDLVDNELHSFLQTTMDGFDAQITEIQRVSATIPRDVKLVWNKEELKRSIERVCRIVAYDGDKRQIVQPICLEDLEMLKELVQSAASRLDDSNGSEDRTLSRIRDFSEYFSGKDCYDSCFQTMSKRVTILLQEQYKHLQDTECDWLQRTANCGEDIQSSGTIRKAVNLRINETITPLLAELIALLDRNGNLELGLIQEDVPPCIQNIWQTIFNDERLLVLTYKDNLSSTTLRPRVRVPVLSDGPGGKFFKATFPFSWMIMQMTSDLFKDSRIMIGLGINSENQWIDFESHFDQTPIGKYISQIFLIEEDNAQYFLLYLRDFIFMKIYPRVESDYIVFEYVILKCIEIFTQASGMNEKEHMPNAPTIPKIHCAYEESKQLIEFLQQAFHSDQRLGPILCKTIFKLRRDNDQRLNCLEHLLLEEIISLCSHKRELTASEELAEKYISQIRQLQAVVEKGLTFKPRDEFYKQNQLKIRYMWDRITAVQLFISHCAIGVGLNVTESSINRLFMLLGETPDFTSADIIKHVLSIISNCLREIGKEAGQLKEKFKEHATRFFISILTNLTFKSLEAGPQNTELIKLLMKFVKLDEEGISQLLTDRASTNIFTKNGLDPTPAFRTFLLQLLISFNKIF